MEKLLSDIAKELFSKFIVNTSVVGVQQESGIYLATKAPVCPFLIKKMLKSEGALGAYQQLTYKDMLRWICFDFDCTKDAGGTVDELKEKYIRPFLKKLDDLKIKYILEFSGRRGFHIWVLFNCAVSKNLGYQIVEKLLEDLTPLLAVDSKYGVDKFPKCLSGRQKNKYGSMVKIPLSRHQRGTYSYFITDFSSFSCDKVESLKSSFLEKQLTYLRSCSENNLSDLLLLLNLKENEFGFENVMKRQIIYVNGNFSFDQLEKAFKSDEALSIIWNNIVNGNMTIKDRKVMLGAFSHVSEGEKLLWDIFKQQGNYNQQVTNEEIQKNKKYFFPLTMKYIHGIYNVNPCEDMQSVTEYLLNELNIPYKRQVYESVKKSLIEDVVDKEKKYYQYNDEVLNIDIARNLEDFSFYDIGECEVLIRNILAGNASIPQKVDYLCFTRKEESKERKMVSLGAKERVVTTMLSYQLMQRLQTSYKSYSYHLNLSSGGDVFYPWIKSWGDFVQDVSVFFNLKLLEDFCFIKADLKSCYDSICLPILRETVLSKIDFSTSRGREIRNICDYLISFNERLMLDITDNSKGVPQGPAYARVLVELILDSLIELFWKENESFVENVRIYRYVDDMYIFYDDSVDGDDILKSLSKILECYNLFFNKEKTAVFGKISEMPNEQRQLFKELNQMMYDVQQEKSVLLGDSDPCEALDRFILRKEKWDINDANFILSDCVDSENRIKYIQMYFEKIICSELGRGSIFRKFYKIIFSNQSLFKIFFEKEFYKKIPLNTVNFKNFIYQLFCLCKNKQVLCDTRKMVRKIADEFIKNEDVENMEKCELYAILQ